MARRLNWQERAFDFKAKRALKDEEELARLIGRRGSSRAPNRAPWARRYDHHVVASETKRRSPQSAAPRPSSGASLPSLALRLHRIIGDCNLAIFRSAKGSLDHLVGAQRPPLNCMWFR